MANKKWAFRTPVSERIRKHTEPGKHIEEVLAMKLDEKGNEIFYVSGQHNVFEETQAYKDEVNIERIIAQCINTGDMNILNQVKKEYVDLTETPNNLIDAKNKIMKAENGFYQLPLEIREKYGNNFNKYLADVGSEEWMKNMGFIKEEKPTEEVKTEEGEKEE